MTDLMIRFIGAAALIIGLALIVAAVWWMPTTDDDQ